MTVKHRYIFENARLESRSVPHNLAILFLIKRKLSQEVPREAQRALTFLYVAAKKPKLG